MDLVKSFGSVKGKEKTEFMAAVIDSLPIMLGVIPFGITCGIMGITAGLTALEVMLMSVLVFAGSAQFVSISMLASGITGWGVIVFTTLLVNLRHLLMGASLAQYMLRLSTALQALLSFWLTDEAYALTVSRIQKFNYNGTYQLGVSVSLYTVWIISTVFGVIFTSKISDPLVWGLDFAIPATFLVLLIPNLIKRIDYIVCFFAAVISILGVLYLPGKWYIIVTCFVASGLGVLLEGCDKNEK